VLVYPRVDPASIAIPVNLFIGDKAPKVSQLQTPPLPTQALAQIWLYLRLQDSDPVIINLER
jgi:hypothetical protein